MRSNTYFVWSYNLWRSSYSRYGFSFWSTFKTVHTKLIQSQHVLIFYYPFGTKNHCIPNFVLRNVKEIIHCSYNVKILILFIKLKNFGQRAMQWKGVLYIHVIICQCRYALIIYGNTKCRPIYIICCWCGGGFCVIWSSSIRFFMQNALLSFFRRPLFFALGFFVSNKNCIRSI